MDRAGAVKISIYCIVCFMQSCFSGTGYLSNYYFEVYQPSLIECDLSNPPPPEYHISNFTWFCYNDNKCQSAVMQMIAAKNGIHMPAGYFSFLTGFSYGAGYDKGIRSFMPFGDPESGLIAASPHLGFKREYLYTNDEAQLLYAIKYYISHDIPVSVTWNSAKTYGLAAESGYMKPEKHSTLREDTAYCPHSVVFTGYDTSSYYYYETQGADFELKNEKGVMIRGNTLAEAILSFSSAGGLPWKYMIKVFIPDKVSDRSIEIWKNTGNMMTGTKFGRTSTGSLAIRSLSDDMRREGTGIDKEPLNGLVDNMVQSLADSRKSNADFLKNTFPSDFSVNEAVTHILNAVQNYMIILAELERNDLRRKDVRAVCTLLDNAASEEEIAGMIMADLKIKVP